MDLEVGRDLGVWKRSERTLIRVFLILFIAFTIVQVVTDLIYRELMDRSFWTITLGIGQDLVVAYAATSALLGIYFVYAFKGEGIVPLREIVTTMFQVAVVIGLFFSILLAMGWGGYIGSVFPGVDEPAGSAVTVVELFVYTVYFFAVVMATMFLAQLGVMVGGFGIIGMLYVFEVGGMPGLLYTLRGITRREDMESKVTMWFFTIHRALDTETVLVDEPGTEKTFPNDRFRRAVGWQVLFGFIIAVYVSLNPWLLRDFTISQLFRFMSTAFVVVPLMVLPWFIHARLNSRIKGTVKDFTIYAALKDRVVRLIIAGGTILIFVRMAMEEFTIEDLLAAFSSYIFVMVLCITAFTFIYYNFFENRLAEEIYRRWVRLEEAREASEGSDEEEGPSKEGVGDTRIGSEEDVSTSLP
jgi:hypothetical protein